MEAVEEVKIERENDEVDSPRARKEPQQDCKNNEESDLFTQKVEDEIPDEQKDSSNNKPVEQKNISECEKDDVPNSVEQDEANIPHDDIQQEETIRDEREVKEDINPNEGQGEEDDQKHNEIFSQRGDGTVPLSEELVEDVESDDDLIDRRRRVKDRDDSDESETSSNKGVEHHSREQESEDDETREDEAVGEQEEDEKTLAQQKPDEDDEWQEEVPEEELLNEGEEQDPSITKDSPMFIPRGRYYHHDSRFDADSGDEEDRKEVQKLTPTTPSQEVGRWEHDLYDPEKQKPREEWEKERDRRYYQELDRRRESGEMLERKSGRGNRGTRLGQYIPRRVQEEEKRNTDRRSGDGRGYQGRRDHDGDSDKGRQRHRDNWVGRNRGNDRESRGRREDDGEGRGGSSGSKGEQRIDGRQRERPNQRVKQLREEEWGEEKEGPNERNKKWEEPKQNGSSWERGPKQSRPGKSFTIESTEEYWGNDNEEEEKEGVSSVGPMDTKGMEIEHSGSLFLKKEPTQSNDSFTSKVFSLSSQTNRLIVKDINSSSHRSRPLGRGRGRVTRKMAGAESESPGGMRSAVEIPGDSLPQEKEVVEKDAVTNQKENPSEDGLLSAKPKRYSSRRQKAGGGDVNGEEKEAPDPSGIAANQSPKNRGPQPHPQPHPLPSYPNQWHSPPPINLPESVTQQQQMMLMMQHQMFLYQQQMRMFYPDGFPPIPGAVPMIPNPEHVQDPSQVVPPIHHPPLRDTGGRPPNHPKPGLFIPPFSPDQQTQMQPPVTHKQSHAIPIVPPKSSGVNQHP